MSAHFLITDRDPLIRDGCRRILESRGYAASVAADALQCLEQLEELQVADSTVLVLDPEILWGGGRGVLTWLREESPLGEVKVILTDGHSQPELPPELQELVTCRLERPGCLTELCAFAHRLQDCVETPPEDETPMADSSEPVLTGETKAAR